MAVVREEDCGTLLVFFSFHPSHEGTVLLTAVICWLLKGCKKKGGVSVELCLSNNPCLYNLMQEIIRKILTYTFCTGVEDLAQYQTTSLFITQ